ncbi:hypothetical protein B296_00051545 [Ensete ventricosum]|uniref:Uncharacterized protein n=1 Tax=Ensete ventricosum TaxID=4639 RepID=A0A426Y341_ENSVE|nr:hypothetical protein B296_00051545 [Ensete ventricosum]
MLVPIVPLDRVSFKLNGGDLHLGFLRKELLKSIFHTSLESFKPCIKCIICSHCAAEGGDYGCEGRWQRLAVVIEEESKATVKVDWKRLVSSKGKRGTEVGKKGGKEDYDSGSSGWKSRMKQRRLEERAAAVAGSWRGGRPWGGGVGGGQRQRRRWAWEEEDSKRWLRMAGAGDCCDKEGNGAAGQRSPTRATAEENDRGLAGGNSGREAREEGSTGGEREMVADGRSKGQRRAWLQQRRLRQRKEKAAGPTVGRGSRGTGQRRCTAVAVGVERKRAGNR